MGTGLGWGSNRLVVQWTSDPLTAIYNNLAQPLLKKKKKKKKKKRRWAPLDALKSVITQFTFYLLIWVTFYTAVSLFVQKSIDMNKSKVTGLFITAYLKVEENLTYRF